MKLKYHKHEHFSLGFNIDFHNGHLISIGWITISLVPKFQSILNELPPFPTIHWPCKQCGRSDEGQGCNMDEKMEVTNCSKCSEVIIK